MCTLFDEIAKEGEAKGIELGIQALIESLQELDIPFVKALNQVMDKFSLSEEYANKQMAKYWK